MEQLIQILKQVSLFSDLSEQVIKNEILPLSRTREIIKGNQLIGFQEKCGVFGIILSGKISILHIYGDGDYAIMGILEPLDLFGADLAFTRSQISPYYAVATQQTKVLTFPADMVLISGFLSEPTRQCLQRKMLAFLADENMRKEYRLAVLFQKGIRDRIMTFLTMQANKRHTTTFTVPFTRDEMASYLCVNRSCLSRELGKMEQEGIIQFSKNTFTILKMNGE